MTGIRQWLVGKKTYLLGGILLLAAVGLTASGRMTVQAAMSVLVFAACLFPMTLRSALAKHQAQSTQILQAVADALRAVATHDYHAAHVAAMNAATRAAELYPELQGDGATASTSRLVPGPMGAMQADGMMGPAGMLPDTEAKA